MPEDTHIMAAGLVLIGILTGMLAAVSAGLFGLGLVAALAAYPLGGIVGTLMAAVFVALCPSRRAALPSALSDRPRHENPLSESATTARG